jgi:GH15 family glucan-1,4-alpha-glucosidase
MPRRIEDYAMIGDCETAALIGRDGSIDWLCWPRFDSDACFAALLGNDEHGRWLLAPEGEIKSSRRRYRDDTLILETNYETATGAITVIDFMPPRGEGSDLIRLAICERGEVAMRTELVIRFGYGNTVPWVTNVAPDTWRAIAGPDMVMLRTSAPMRGENLKSVAEFTLRAGEKMAFTLVYALSTRAPFAFPDPEQALQETESFWTEWAKKCLQLNRWEPEIRRSLTVLRALIHAPTGGIIAAPTTSLPEQLGGTRNWDYRYCWLRDATLTLLALMDAGYYDEACAWRDWLLRAVAGSPHQLQIMYGVAGERRLLEWAADWLPGYDGAKPVRIGNEAHRQRQLDVFGEIMDALHQARAGGLPPLEATWALQVNLLEFLEQIWHEPDYGIWEVRGPPQQFTHSKIMAWVAFDRAIKDAEQYGFKCPLPHWKALRDQIHDDVCERAFDRARNTFVQAYGSKQLDASLLLIPELGFLPADDPRVRGTVEAIEATLLKDGFVLRYDTAETNDGLPPGEGAFLACSFWLVNAYAMIGRRDDAIAMFERLLALANDVGLLAEEYDARHERLVGNFPQGLSHLSLIVTAFNLAHTDKPAEQRAEKPSELRTEEER